ncbi:Uncharacterized protein M6B38_233345 [Iris pallida]|uniref:Avr9/Cf-9 rapidly elicited protein 146 n=1 Tax=Iris pallida TaxID=29817 RepID=A0AAX6DQF4_IRIPA|nr:Uncharacterized protein M6B38_233345 [Iris pallida]
MESSRPPTIAKKLWHIFQVVYYMLRKGMPKRKLMMDLHLLLKRGKIAGKALGSLMTFHSHHHHHHSSSSTGNAAAASSAGSGSGFSCRSMDPNLSFYDPREVEFSCSNTPSYPSLAKHGKKRHHCGHRDYDYEAATAIAKAFEILNAEAASAAASDLEPSSSVAPSPMRTPMWRFGKSPAAVRQLRITDSPFPIKEDEVADGEVDKEAEEFIRRFYEQLRRQQSIGATPDYYRARRR